MVICSSCYENLHFDCERPAKESENGKRVLPILHTEELSRQVKNIKSAFIIFNYHKEKNNMECVRDFAERLEKFEEEWDHLRYETVQAMRMDDFLKYDDIQEHLKCFFIKLKESDLYSEFANNLLHKHIQKGVTMLTDKPFEELYDLEQGYWKIREKQVDFHKKKLETLVKQKDQTPSDTPTTTLNSSRSLPEFKSPAESLIPDPKVLEKVERHVSEVNLVGEGMQEETTENKEMKME
ncbi:unnamed protein product [Moneuplotes crassus]|uniref:Uncharacterized protein n=1 Tax=Euplotes crassus TaxID=5936 RepID=A0AAD1X5Y8_EUPCR|nr:unnamed protein product [Moneuplotes crassus]